MKQTERLLAYLQEHETIDPLTSWQVLGIYRLTSRIWDLKQEGHTIITSRKKVSNRYGESCTVAEYRLAK